MRGSLEGVGGKGKGEKTTLGLFIYFSKAFISADLEGMAA